MRFLLRIFCFGAEGCGVTGMVCLYFLISCKWPFDLRSPGLSSDRVSLELPASATLQESPETPRGAPFLAELWAGYSAVAPAQPSCKALSWAPSVPASLILLMCPVEPTSQEVHCSLSKTQDQPPGLCPGRTDHSSE